MKKILLLISLLNSLLLFAQTDEVSNGNTAKLSNENYIHTVIPQAASSSVNSLNLNNKIESVTYYDGLGRPMQSIAMRAGGLGEDVITHIEYDNYGRSEKEYLPYSSSISIGEYRSGALINTNNYYKNSKYVGDLDINNPNTYSQKVFEVSPLNRVLKQGAPGSSWSTDSGNELNYKYSTNNYDELIPVYGVDYKQGRQFSLIQNGIYATGDLFKTIIKTENWKESDGNDNTFEEYTNIKGQVILKRNYNNQEKLDTFFVYDNYNNLVYVIPPSVSEGQYVSSLIIRDGDYSELYIYKYDSSNRLAEKKIPGKDWEYIVYNEANQPILTQDALLRENDEWLFTKYDAFGRVTYTGIWTNTTNRYYSQEDIQEYSLEQMGNFYYEQASSTTNTIDSEKVYYTNNSFPNTNIKLHTINYYDTYHFLENYTLPSTVFGVTVSNKTKTLPTGSKIKVLGTNDWIFNALAYDDKGRVLFAYTENEYLNTFDETESQYDFVGKVLKTRHTHIKENNDPIVTQDVFTYDHAGRLIDQHQCIGDDTLSEFCGEANADVVAHLIIEDDVITESSIETATEEITFSPELIIEATDDDFDFIGMISEDAGLDNAELIAENTYDELGQLESKKVGNSKASPLQTVDYSYNIRGWLKGINDTSSLGNDLFSFKLNYNITDLSGSTALFNGNISEAHWKSANDNTTSNYAYSYDALDRITGAISNEPLKYNLSGIAYDKMGNIESLIRKGAVTPDATSFGTIDNLNYQYAGNQLQSVTDDGHDDFGFKDGNTSSIDYEYDDNGNMITDLNKGIQSISYNYLNLPTFIEVNSVTENGSIQYVYDAAGIKHQKQVFENGVAIATTDYAGNYVYENDELKFFNHPEGYFDVTGTSTLGELEGAYVYQYKDNLGNIRLSYADDNKDGSVDADEIREVKDYYPFGLQMQYGPDHSNSIVRGRQHNYGYNGVEQESELGLNLLSMDLRKYDPTIARWTSIDPVTHHSLSTYNAFDNNPIYWADPSGADSQDDFWGGGGTSSSYVNIRGLSDGGSFSFGAGAYKGSEQSPDDVIFNVVGEDGKRKEIGRVVMAGEDVNVDINSGVLPQGVEDSLIADPVKVDPGETANALIEESGIQAVSLDVSAEAAFKVGVQMELSLIGIIAGDKKGDWGVTVQTNGLVGLEGSVTGSASIYWPLGNKNLALNDLKGFEYGIQGSVFGVAGAYFEGFGLSGSVYRGASLGGSGGIPELAGGSGSGYIGYSEFLYRSDK